MPKEQARPSPVSRRSVLSAAASAPAVGVANSPCSRGRDDLAARCTAWLALDLEIDRLCLRWSQLETQAVREFGWFNLGHAERQALPMVPEMAAIDTRLETLFEARQQGLAGLRRIKPTDIHGAASKLVVASRVSQYEGGEVHDFIVEGIKALSAMTCPACGAPYAPPSSRS
ncbi:hypothetical protein [Caulobacter soli]|uniref:hypothetical protein n=1 Tax=Caulobacter soli TaxID=2708539 RepID=UPI0013EB7EA8|nr:hypothetical protein [Caulobacter soli]